MSTVHISPYTLNLDNSVADYLRLHRASLSPEQLYYTGSMVYGEGGLSGVYEVEIEEAKLEVAIGGHYTRATPERVKGVSGLVGGGTRGDVTGYSRQSRRRFLMMVGKINKFSSPIFATITYPDEFSENKDDWKRDIDVLGKRIARKFDNVGLFWRIEFVERKTGQNAGKIAPHFHLLLWGVSAVEFRKWLPDAWFGVVGSNDGKHLLAGTNVERLKSWNGVMSYVSKYIAKSGQFPDGWSGRVWGVIGRDNIPWCVMVTIALPGDVAKRLIRLGRKFCKLDGKTLVFGLSWLMNTERVLDWLEWAMGQSET